jgi:hypothetical protein
MAFIKENYKEEYPFKSNYFTHKSGLMQHYVDEGNGQPFLMVHGNPSWSFLYRDMIKSFMGDYRCIAPDHIGCGLSEKPDNTVFPYTLKAHIDNLEALIDSLNLTQPLVIAVRGNKSINRVKVLSSPVAKVLPIDKMHRSNQIVKICTAFAHPLS